jgi:hypothetical protein
MVAYAAKSDVYKFGLPRGALGNPGRLVASSLAATSTIELGEHGFSTDDAVTFRATEGGTLSAPLVAGTVYYVIELTDSTFQVATAPATGVALTLTSDGVSMVVSMDLPFDDVLEFYSRFVDGFLPADAVPLTAPYPVTVVGVVAELTAKKIQILSGMRSGSMDEAEVAAGAQLKRWAAGLPVRDAAQTTQHTNLAVVRTPRDENVVGNTFFRRWGGGINGDCV